MSLREQTVAEICRRRLSAIIRTDDQDCARHAMRAAVDGGFGLVEFTLTTPGALDLIREFSAMDDLLVGAGTVLTIDAARAAVDAGARFLVSPLCDPLVIKAAAELDVASIPGTFTATEMQAAHLAGADFVKLFPAPADVPAYVRAMRGPLPHLRIYPTNGVTLENVVDVLNAGAAGAGFVAPLFNPDWLAQADYDAVRRQADAIVSRVRAAGFIG